MDHADRTRGAESLRPLSGFAAPRRAPNGRQPRGCDRRRVAWSWIGNHADYARLLRRAFSGCDPGGRPGSGDLAERMVVVRRQRGRVDGCRRANAAGVLASRRPQLPVGGESTKGSPRQAGGPGSVRDRDRFLEQGAHPSRRAWGTEPEIGLHMPVYEDLSRLRDSNRYNSRRLALTPGTRPGVYEVTAPIFPGSANREDT